MDEVERKCKLDPRGIYNNLLAENSHSREIVSCRHEILRFKPPWVGCAGCARPGEAVPVDTKPPLSRVPAPPIESTL